MAKQIKFSQEFIQIKKKIINIYDTIRVIKPGNTDMATEAAGHEGIASYGYRLDALSLIHNRIIDTTMNNTLYL